MARMTVVLLPTPETWEEETLRALRCPISELAQIDGINTGSVQVHALAEGAATDLSSAVVRR